MMQAGGEVTTLSNTLLQIFFVAAPALQAKGERRHPDYRPAANPFYSSTVAASLVSDADHRCCDNGADAVVVGATDECGVAGSVAAAAGVAEKHRCCRIGRRRLAPVL